MIPIRLTLHQFLSYRSAVLDFTGIHTACISGPNGAGKSALLEALTWGIWGQSRASNDDDLIHKGATETQVEVIYESRDQVYRILRTRSLQSSTHLEWQIQSISGWRSLTRKGLRATQQAIQAQLHLDYETFINSAYLRQGRADEFTVKRPGERKQILAEILKLGDYESLAEQCRDHAKTAKLQSEVLLKQLNRSQEQKAEISTIQSNLETLQQQLQLLQTEQASDQEQLQCLKEQAEQRQTLHQHYQNLTQQLTNLTETLQTTENQWRHCRQQQQELEDLLHREPLILKGSQRYEVAFEEDQRLNQLFQRHQALTQDRHQLQDQLTQHQQKQILDLQHQKAELAALNHQRQSDHHILQDQERITQALQTYRHAKEALTLFDRKHGQAAPLLAQHQVLAQQLQQQKGQLLTRRSVIQEQIDSIQTQQAQWQEAQQTVLVIEAELATLQKQRVYRQRVYEKAQERRLFVYKLQERLRSLQRQWQLVEEAQHLIRRENATNTSSSTPVACPLCTQRLTETLRQTVLDKQLQELSDLEAEMLVIREQLAVADREIELLDLEYQSLSDELDVIERQQEAKGRFQYQVESGRTQLAQLQQLQQQLERIETTLATETYAASVQEQLAKLEAELAALGYDEKDHTLCRNEVDRWRWAESKSSELKKAQSRQAKLEHDIQLLHQSIQAAEASFETSPQTQALKQTLQALDQSIESLGYDVSYHQAVRSELTQTHIWLSQRETLYQAHQQLPDCQARCQTLVAQLQQQRQTFTQSTRKLEELHQQLTQLPIVTESQIKTVTARITQRRHHLDQLIAQIGATQQRLEQKQQLDQEQATLTQQLHQIRHQTQVYQELAHAFGRNGIPALIIENALPELEAEANRILARLTANQLHLKFVTQRSGRRSSKLIDTLDIFIADTQGTRPYETYSGGEAFRINFAIRLALSQFLAQRAGARLQTLLIDEGFGSQDQTGRQQLVAAINAVAPDFARILVITHIPNLKDAFSQRIEVHRGPQGSEVQIIS